MSPSMKIDKTPVSKKYNSPDYIEMRRVQELSNERRLNRDKPESPLPSVNKKKIDFTLEMKGKEPISTLMQRREMKNFYHPSFE